MAFDFLGKLESLEQWEEFKEFFTKEMEILDFRIEHLTAEIKRLTNLLGKFKSADLFLRSGYEKSKPPDFNYVKTARSIEPLGIDVIDTVTAIDVDILKKSVLDSIKAKRERNEWKVKRIRDLKEQYTNEIAFLREQQDTYEEILIRMRSRFDSNEFEEIQLHKKEDEIDINQNLRVLPKDAGKFITEETIYYVILNISSEQRAITFEQIAPPVKVGQVITLSRGENDGDKTVTSIKNDTTLEVEETLVDETPATSLAVIKS